MEMQLGGPPRRLGPRVHLRERHHRGVVHLDALPGQSANQRRAAAAGVGNRNLHSANFDNWAYQPSYASSNTPWFFNGVRIQWFPANHLKIEPWFINGWQSYNRLNGHPGLGGQIKWTPKPWMNIIGNQYGVDNDNVGLPNRGRYHTDNSI
jgi:hypothetical protein